MKKLFKFLRYAISSLLGILLLYFIFALLLTEISVNSKRNTKPTHKIYLLTNGIHLDLVLSVENIDQKILHQLPKKQNTQYVSLGWGDKNFYLNTPEWKDLTTQNAVNALFLNSKSLIHIYQYPALEKEWVEVPLDKKQLETLNRYILNSFETDSIGNIQLLKGKGYGPTDDFFKAKGSYSIFKTCNTWVNTALKNSDLKACLWTPFDYGVLKKYQ